MPHGAGESGIPRAIYAQKGRKNTALCRKITMKPWYTTVMARAGRIPHICARQGETYEKNEDVQARHARGHGCARHHGGGYFLACSSGNDGEEVILPPGGSTVGEYIPPTFEGSYFPQADATDAYADTDLMVNIGKAVTINRDAEFAVKIFKADDDTLVDTIKPKGETQHTWAEKQWQTVNVDDQLVQAAGNVLLIKPHSAKTDGKTVLEPDTAYYVQISGDLVAGYAGIADKSWKFTTKSAPSIS
ncbi:MAG: Ig-like domain-containing protein, partial [Treponemataceae bacterium]|nr:Ig-like domain-containing protein [Treponemataceae bacterium]